MIFLSAIGYWFVVNLSTISRGLLRFLFAHNGQEFNYFVLMSGRINDFHYIISPQYNFISRTSILDPSISYVYRFGLAVKYPTPVYDFNSNGHLLRIPSINCLNSNSLILFRQQSRFFYKRLITIVLQSSLNAGIVIFAHKNGRKLGTKEKAPFFILFS